MGGLGHSGGGDRLLHILCAQSFEAGVLASLLGYIAAQVLMLLLPITIVVAVLRYGLYEIDLIINRTLVYGSLTVLLVLVYLEGVTATQAIFRALSGQGSTLAVVVSTLVIAALFNPLRRRIQAFIDRRFTGRSTTPQRPSKPSRPSSGTRQTWTP
jgi:hypothetical protein